MEDLLVEKELMSVVLGLAGFMHCDLPLLGAVSQYSCVKNTTSLLWVCWTLTALV